MTAYRDLLPVAVEAAERAARILRQRVPGALTSKGDRDFASEVDYEIERDLRAFLCEATPDIGFLGEEEGISGGGEMQWALDPVDGTVNFVHGLPLCAVSLGLIHHRRAVLGVVELPFLGDRYSASENGGAHKNGKLIRVSPTVDPSAALVAIGDYAVGPDAPSRNSSRLALTARLAGVVQRIRMTGSAALDLVWLAEGRIDVAVTLSNHPWDMTAGVAIARSAGATVLDRDGTDHTTSSSVTLAVTPGLAGQLLEHLRSV